MIRAGLLQSTLIVLPAEEKVANIFAGDTVDWVFDGGHVASRFISVKPADGDLIDLRGLNAKLGEANLQNIQFVGSAMLFAPNQIGYYIEHGDTWVQGSFGSSAAANFYIHLKGIHQLKASDFLLSTVAGQPTYTVGYTVY